MSTIPWTQNTATKMWEPTGYPSDIKFSDYDLPNGIQTTFQHLNSIIETKYTREYVKMCAFYNKLFPSLKSWDWSRSSHNSLPFSVQEQERQDGGTGISENFLKNAIDTVVARIANIKFEPSLRADIPNLLHEIYKEPIERYLKGVIKNNRLVSAVTEVFHDAAILGYGHLFIDPWSGDIRKVDDWEFGCYESEFAAGSLQRVLIRDFAFPVTKIAPYVKGMPEEDVKKMLTSKPQVDLKLFIDTLRHEAIATIDTFTMPAIEYPFDEVLLTTYSWDLGIKKTTTTSLFDLLYPVQRAISKLNAKKTQLIDAYKGPVPVFSNDCDVIVKRMGNGAGEGLFLASGRNPAEVVTVINPTPLDPEMNAEKETLKSTLQELAGSQELSLDMENIRSAATVIALDQLHDKRLQSQLSNIGLFVSDTLEMAIRFAASRPEEALPIENVPWEDVITLVDLCYIDVKVLHNPTEDPLEPEPDYTQILIDKAVISIMRGNATYNDFVDDYSIDQALLRKTMALKLVRLRSMLMIGENNDPLDNLERALLGAYIEDIKLGKVVL